MFEQSLKTYKLEEVQQFLRQFNLKLWWTSFTCPKCEFVHAVSISEQVCSTGKNCSRCNGRVEWC